MTAAPPPRRAWPRLGAFAARVLEELADPAQIERYQSANAALLAGEAERPRTVFIGDSTVQLWLELESLAPPGARWVNRGISGQTSSQVLLRFGADVIALRPVAVLIVAGANDLRALVGSPASVGPAALARIARNITAMADMARGGGVRVAIAAVPPVAAPFAGRRRGAARRDPAVIVQANAWLRSFAASRAYPFFDLHSALAGPDGRLSRSHTDDGIHPNPAGYRILAGRLAAVLAAIGPDALEELPSEGLP